MSNLRYALISVSDKTGVVEVASALVQTGVTLLSTGGTFDVLSKAGLPVVSVDSVTNFPEMMDGRVKTLHPLIHGGLLALRDNADHLAAMEKHNIDPIDYVIVNLYPFRQTIEKPNVTFKDAIENIDIGGPSMLRSAAKNHQSVTVVTDPDDYATLIEQLTENGKTTHSFRRYLARKVYQLTAHYDALISDYLLSEEESSDYLENDWSFKTLTYVDGQSLRYGENSHQNAKVYQQLLGTSYSLIKAKQIHGKELSYNNYRDGDAAIKIAREFEEPVAVAVKHMNPCGVAIGETIEQAFDRTYQADPISIFGGIIVLNRPVTLALAEKLHEIFLEIIIAPAFDTEALNLLTQKKNLRLMILDFSDMKNSYQEEIVGINGGILVQDSDISTELNASNNNWEVMTERQPNEREVKALVFGMKVCKHVKSNAIVIANEFMSLGIGAGQMNRIGSAMIALEQASKLDKTDESPIVMASDAFFPMDDSVKAAANYQVTAIIQPGGSIKDSESVDVCNKENIAMVKTGIRHFKH